MCRTGEAINAAMLTSAIRVDRLVERDIRRSIACNDRTADIANNFGFKRGKGFIFTHPAIVKADIAVTVIAAGGIGSRSSALNPPRTNHRCKNLCHANQYTRQREQNKNNYWVKTENQGLRSTIHVFGVSLENPKAWFGVRNGGTNCFEFAVRASVTGRI